MDLYNASMGEDAPDEIELTLEQYQEAKDHYEGIIARGDAAKRLAENDDFKLLVMQGFLTDEPMRLAELMASGRLAAASMDNCKNELFAVGAFRNYMKQHVEQAGIARQELAALEEAREIALKQEAGE